MLEIKKKFITRWIARWYEKELLKDVVITWEWEMQNVQAVNNYVANDYLVREMCEITQEELDEINNKDYEIILKKLLQMLNKDKKK